MDKAAIVVLADTETHGELGRLVNALSTADEFKENGDEVTIIFDGAGVRWAAELSKPEHRLHEKFEGLRDKVAGACHYCAGAFEVRDELEQIGFPLLRDHKGHPSLRTLVHDGYEIVTF
jgi:hypothetical protein